MPNPQNITNLNKRRTAAERKAAAAKAGRASGRARKNYANLRECFKEELTSEMMVQAFDKLWDMFVNHGNLNAFDRIVEIIGDDEPTTNHVTITFASEEMEEYGD